jgi:hypothetical protein
MRISDWSIGHHQIAFLAQPGSQNQVTAAAERVEPAEPFLSRIETFDDRFRLGEKRRRQHCLSHRDAQLDPCGKGVVRPQNFFGEASEPATR